MTVSMTCADRTRRAIALASFLGGVAAFGFSVEFGLEDASSLAFVGMVLLTVYLLALSMIWEKHSEWSDAIAECIYLAILLGLILSIYDGVEKRKKETAYDGIMQKRQLLSEIQIIGSICALIFLVLFRSIVWCCCIAEKNSAENKVAPVPVLDHKLPPV